MGTFLCTLPSEGVRGEKDREEDGQPTEKLNKNNQYKNNKIDHSGKILILTPITNFLLLLSDI